MNTLLYRSRDFVQQLQEIYLSSKNAKCYSFSVRKLGLLAKKILLCPLYTTNTVYNRSEFNPTGISILQLQWIRV